MGILVDNKVVAGIHEDTTAAEKQQASIAKEKNIKTIDCHSDTLLHRNHGCTWASLPPSFMRFILGACEPVALSSANMKKAYVKKGGREPPKDVLQ